MATSRTGTSRWKRVRTEALREAQNRGQTHCPLCTTLLDYTRGRTPASAEPDHIIPYARGGTDTLDNLRIICRHCNQSLGDRRNFAVTQTSQPAATTTMLLTW